jgi:hypothetical protein
MIFINPNAVVLPIAREKSLKALTEMLLGWPEELRKEFIEGNREETWGHQDVLDTMTDVVGNKCWYSEVYLEGADPNVDHFRPKGRVREVGPELEPTGVISEGYWWLAFDPDNYRLAALHANQRRVDRDSHGGKCDFFPIRGPRAPSGTPLPLIDEDVLPLDPCSMTDVQLLMFDLDGIPGPAKNSDDEIDERDAERVRATIWLYHLKKSKIKRRRTAFVQDIRKDLKKAHADYLLWDRHSPNPNLQARNSFNQKIAEIRTKIEDDAEFAGAKRLSTPDYPWIDELHLV